MPIVTTRHPIGFDDDTDIGSVKLRIHDGAVANERPQAQIALDERRHPVERDLVIESVRRKFAHDGASELRRRLADPATPREFPILDDLAAEGVTDYLIVPLRFSSRRVNAVSIATDRPVGFSDAEIARFENLTPLLALVLEVKETQRFASTLLDTYLGHDAGRRVLGGLVQRGDGITLAAALWYCDLRSFTATTETLPRDQIIALLNDYFACMATAWLAFGSTCAGAKLGSSSMLSTMNAPTG